MKRSLAILALCVSLFSHEDLVYESTTQGNTIKTNWEVKKKEGMLHVFYKDAKEETTMELTEGYELRSFIQKNIPKKTLFSAKVSGNRLSASLKGDGEPLDKSYTIKFPWIQEFSMGLKPLVKSNKRDWKFTVINPHDLTINQMIASKQGTETIRVAGKEYKALKVKITLQGFKSLFWKAYSWWDEKEVLMLRYQGNDGPNTPTTTINFVSKKETIL